MKHIIIAILILWCTAAVAQTDSRGIGKVYYDSVVNSLRNLHVAMDRCYKVKDLMLQRDAATFAFDGTICLTKPIFGRTCAAVFQGKGHVTMTPPTAVEREQLMHFNKMETLDRDVGKALFFFSDSSAIEMTQGMATDQGASEDDLQSILDGMKNYFVNEKFLLTPWTLYSNILNRVSNNFFMAYLYGDGQESDDLYMIDPEAPEQVYLYRSNGFNRSTSMELINNFSTADEYERGIDPNADHTAIQVDSYKIDARISPNLDVSFVCGMNVHSIKADRSWAVFNLGLHIEIDSILVNDRPTCFYYKGGKLFIQLDHPTTPGGTYHFDCIYHGAIFDRQVDAVTMRAGHLSWYPWITFSKKALFDITFHNPSNLQVLCSAREVSQVEDHDSTSSHWISDGVISGCTFTVGPYERFTVDHDNSPKVRLWRQPGIRREGIVAEEICSSYKYFESVLGPLDDTLTVIVSTGYAQDVLRGYMVIRPTPLRTSISYYERDPNMAEYSALQWLGTGLGYSNYHDQWMSDALSKYFGLLYIQSSKKSSVDFFSVLEHERNEVLNVRRSFLGHGIEPAPIWLGSRVGTSIQNREDRQIVIEQKGSWIIHMLRNMMMETHTFSDTAFFNMMKDYYSTWKHKYPTTADFQKMVEKHVGRNMDWFFNEWVYGSSIPHYTVAWKQAKDSVGHYRVQLRVKQDGVADSFTMIVPVRIVFAGNASAIVRLVVTGSQSVIDLPPLGDEAKDIEFSPYDSVLCSIDTEKW